MTARPWSAEDDGWLIAHYHRSPASRIAADLGRSRNAVIGRANRLEKKGLMPAATAKAKAARQPQNVKAKREAAAAEAAEAAARVTQRPIISRDTCRWPIGHPGDPGFHFCGQPADTGSRFTLRRAYCPGHGREAVQPGTAINAGVRRAIKSLAGRDRAGMADLMDRLG